MSYAMLQVLGGLVVYSLLMFENFPNIVQGFIGAYNPFVLGV
jgi:hypothetical protein